VNENNYRMVEIEEYPTKNWDKFKKTVKATLSLELLKGLNIVFKEMIRFDIHTVKYPQEQLPLSPRYRAVHKLYKLLESNYERCIGCGLCEKICISNCIRMDTNIDENGRKEVTEYSINLGRCIFCGYCAEVCPELAIVHGSRYENSSEQRAHFALKDDMITDDKDMNKQQEYDGFGAVNIDADAKIKKTPLSY
jgi:NADH-quinone oxidoreductase subunit I